MAKIICVSTNGNGSNFWAEGANGNTSSISSTNETWRALDVSKLASPFTIHLNFGGDKSHVAASISGVENEDIIVANGNSQANLKLYKVKPDHPAYSYAVTDPFV